MRMNKLKWLFVGLVALTGMSGGVALAQNAAASLSLKTAPFDKVKDDKKADAKKAPDVIPIPEARRDKVDALWAKVEAASYKLAAIEKQYKELQAEQQEMFGKLQAEMASALKLAGLTEKDFEGYTYNEKTFTFTRKPPAPVTPPVQADTKKP